MHHDFHIPELFKSILMFVLGFTGTAIGLFDEISGEETFKAFYLGFIGGLGGLIIRLVYLFFKWLFKSKAQ